MDLYKERTIESYNKHAEEFAEKFKGLFDLRRREEFRKFMDMVPGKKILDIGCGSGDHSLYFKEQGYDVTPIDISESMIKICRGKGLDAKVMDMEEMIFPRNSFDGVWAVTSLLHVPKNRVSAVVEKVHNSLIDSGIFFVSLKEGDIEGLKADYNDVTTRRFFSYWKEDELVRAFQPYFNLIELLKKKHYDTTYLNAFFRKH